LKRHIDTIRSGILQWQIILSKLSKFFSRNCNNVNEVIIGYFANDSLNIIIRINMVHNVTCTHIMNHCAFV